VEDSWLANTCFFWIELLHICNSTGSKNERWQNTDVKIFAEILFRLQMLSIDKKLERRKGKEGSTMPPGHCAELASSILFPGMLDKIYGNNI
jgi:hypothetical protein